MGLRTGNTAPVKNIEHLKIICDALANPVLGAKQLNLLFALRLAWISRGHLVERELLMIRETASSPTSKVEQRRQQALRKEEATKETKKTVVKDALPQTHPRPFVERNKREVKNG